MQKLEKVIGYKFKNKKLLEEALTHPSYSNNLSYERLEFLGDIVLDAIVGIYLYKKFPDKNEAFLTNLKSAYVNKNYLRKVGDKIGLIKFARKRVNTFKKTDKLVEALIGALYLDGGWKSTTKFVKKFILYEELEPLKDYKSLLLDYSRKLNNSVPQYIVKENNSLREKIFEVKVKIKGLRKIGKGKGYSIKEAELQAAKQLYEKIMYSKKT
ncbi:MAG: ribonuclease III [bacterium]|nr:ribonuclease III [bacterium]MDW8163225.1 ribonuclease III [Candidatus Omnitrophota bacterium]